MGPYTFGKRCRFVGFKKRNNSFAQMANAAAMRLVVCINI
jgi:hypothetical protein